VRLLVVALLLAGCAAEPKPHQPAFTFSGKIDNVLLYPGRVEVVNVAKQERRLVGRDAVAALQEVLTSAGTYDDTVTRACKAEPEYRLYFIDRDRVVEITVSFECRELVARSNAVVGEKPVRRGFGRTDGARRLHLILTQL
jgi:hypothetical protein